MILYCAWGQGGGAYKGKWGTYDLCMAVYSF